MKQALVTEMPPDGCTRCLNAIVAGGMTKGFTNHAHGTLIIAKATAYDEAGSSQASQLLV